MKILVINCGSSSVKYTFFDMVDEKRLIKGAVECIGLPEAYFKHTAAGEEEIKEPCQARNHTEAVDIILKNLMNPKHEIINSVSDISAVGHRIVHGGNKFSKSVPINDEVKHDIKECFVMAPVHNPHHYAGIEAVEKLLPGVPEVVVFDTAFHQTLPDYAYIYGLPYNLYQKYNIRRYGFHGTSHHFVAQRAAKMLGKPMDELDLITCHLGNGCSIAAIKKGKSVDTSMGFTPLEGLVMGNRSGDLDPAIILHLMTAENISVDNLRILLNEKSGLYGISGLTNDMRTVLSASINGSERAKLAINVFCYRVKKYICSYFGVLNGADGIVFTAGVGENSPTVREKSLENLDKLAIKIDLGLNNKISQEERFISGPESQVKIMVIPTNEELMIARETQKVLTNQ